MGQLIPENEAFKMSIKWMVKNVSVFMMKRKTGRKSIYITGNGLVTLKS